jgi:hypothetical protein
MSKGVLALSGAGGLAGLYGVYELIQEAHHRSGWFWLFLGATVLFVAQIQTVQRALAERDEALASVSHTERQLRNPQKVIHEHYRPSGVFEDGPNPLTEEQSKMVLRRRAEEEYDS